MQSGYFEDNNHAEAYAQFRPSPPPQLTQRLITFLREKYDDELNVAVDLGCGNGQCTFGLANDFKFVLGLDISPAQITQARKRCEDIKYSNVKFEVSNAESIPVKDGTAQLITICQAVHWMDLDKVYNEARRVLTKNGVLAIISYKLPEYTTVIPSSPSKTDAINHIITKGLESMSEYWPKESWSGSVLQEYSDICTRFPNFTREGYFNYEREVTISDIVGCIRSYSPFQVMIRHKGENAGRELLDTIINKIGLTMNEGEPEKTTYKNLQEFKFREIFSYMVLMMRF